MPHGTSALTFRESRSVALTANDWIEAETYNGARGFLDLQNETGSDFRIQFTKNPFALSFDGADDFVETDAILGDTTLTTAVKGFIRARILRDTGGVGDDTVFSISDASANEYVKLFVDASNILKAELRTAAGGVRWALETDAAIPTAEFIEVKLNHNGVQPFLFVNGNEVPVTRTVTTDEADWINDLSNLDVARIGAINTNGAGNADFYLGDVDWLIVKMSTSRNEGLDLVAQYQIDEGTLTSGSTTIADDSASGFTGNLGAAGAAPAWVERSTGFLLIANTGREFLGHDIPKQAVWAFTAGAGLNLTVTQADRGGNNIFA